jgi:oxaloacetate decarboxylase (Na+ extruding) subunit alpha
MKTSPQKSETQPQPAAPAVVKPRVRITDTTLRDAHQSLWATRMRTDDILGIAETIDRAGYYSLECWGGATFDVCLRFLRENPWERLRQIKAVCKKTPLQMLLRGQNILGYRNYPDDMLERFVALACANGMDIFRIFDALNDTRNLEHAIAAVKKNGGHAQGTLCYTVSPVHTVANFVAIAKTQQAMGIDSLCIKDMAGILSPAAAAELIGALVRETGLPIQVHAHMTSGMAVATYYEAVRAGAGAVDCCVATMSGFSSQPAVETLAEVFESAGYETGLDLEAVDLENTHFRKLKPSREPSHAAIEVVDVDVLLHHVPGGMISNLRSQLQQQDALDRLPEVLEELPRTRKDMGYPPLVTPTSQIVGVQAVLNVLSGERYGMVTQETRDYVGGLYGRPPAPIDPTLATLILAGAKPVTVRPADLLPPLLPQAAKELDPKLIQAEEDILSYCLFPEVALGYFKWRALPAGSRPPSPADAEITAKTAPKAEAAVPVVSPQAAQDSENIRHAQIGRLMANLFGHLGVAVGSGVVIEERATVVTAAPAPAAAVAAPAAAVETGPTINAPLTGTFYRTSAPGKPNLADDGAVVEAGSPVCIVEAMKLMNAIKATKKCRIVAFLAKHGDAVSKGQALARIEWL